LYHNVQVNASNTYIRMRRVPVTPILRWAWQRRTGKSIPLCVSFQAFLCCHSDNTRKPPVAKPPSFTRGQMERMPHSVQCMMP